MRDIEVCDSLKEEADKAVLSLIDIDPRFRKSLSLIQKCYSEAFEELAKVNIKSDSLIKKTNRENKRLEKETAELISKSK